MKVQKPQNSENRKLESVTAKSDAGAKDDKAKADKDKPKPLWWGYWLHCRDAMGIMVVYKVKDKWYFWN